MAEKNTECVLKVPPTDVVLRCKACGGTMMYRLEGSEILVYPCCTPKRVREGFQALEAENARLRAQNEQVLTNDQCAFAALIEAGEKLAERDKLRAAMERIQHFATLRMIASAPGFDRIEEMAREALGKNSTSR